MYFSPVSSCIFSFIHKKMIKWQEGVGTHFQGDGKQSQQTFMALADIPGKKHQVLSLEHLSYNHIALCVL